jgi:type 2A phosphatase activator TIP41
VECQYIADNQVRQEKHQNITEVVKPFDWSYTTDYAGTLSSTSHVFQKSQAQIPVELLKRPDPILFFDEVMLYEDEMADNGITMLSCKIRVMPARLLLLCRFFMRLDSVLFRIRDTRIYIEFSTGQVIREYVAKEEAYETVRQVSSLNAMLYNCIYLTPATETRSVSRRCTVSNERSNSSCGIATCCQLLS